MALSRLILEADRPPRKSQPPTADPHAAKPRPPRQPRSTRRARSKRSPAAALLRTLHPHAAGIDVGSDELWVCLPEGAEPEPPPDHPDNLPARVRRFGAFTADLHALVALLRQAGVDTVALESTGVYWIAL